MIMYFYICLKVSSFQKNVFPFLLINFLLMIKKAEYWIEKLNLKKHPEGGYFRETYRSDLLIEKLALPEGFPGERSISTAIYFLLCNDEFSAFHRIKSDELWHFYCGDSITSHIIALDGIYSQIKFGNNIDNGELFQVIVKA